MPEALLKSSTPHAIVLARGVNALGIIRSLARNSVKTILVSDDARDPSMLSRYPIQKIVLPDLHIEDLLQKIAPYADQDVVIMGASDEFISFISRNLDRLQAHFKVMVPDEKLIDHLIDKRKEIELIQGTGVPLPASASHLPADFRELKSHISFPAIIKPRKSTGTKLLQAKNRIVSSSEELQHFYESYSENLNQFIIQEVVPGNDDALWVCNCFFNEDSELVQAFTFRRMGTSPSHYGVTSYAESVRNDEIIAQVETLGRSFGYIGPAMVEFKWDVRDNLFKYIEINPRIGMCNFFDTLCGINNVYATYRMSAGDSINPSGLRQKERIIFVNFFPDFISRLRDNESLLSIWKLYSKHLFRQRVHAIWYWKDPLPIVSSTRNAFRLIYHLSRRILGIGK